MQRGIHYSNIERKSLTAANRDAILASVPAEVQAFLATRKIGLIEMSPNDLMMGSSNGRYRVKGHEIRLNSSRAPTTYGKPFTRGIPSVSFGGTDSVEAISRTLLHEIGHHIYFSDEATFGPLAAAALAAGSPLTALAAINREEYFAEGVTAYYYHPTEFQRDDPRGYDMVVDVLRRAGVLK
ncbi:MAG: hypothetical protein JWM80_927 [Cyanobacteria bacterium RYN_339]|nr:hypothetical protein [Cyanobacteria bacterium RYN_339]